MALLRHLCLTRNILVSSLLRILDNELGMTILSIETIDSYTYDGNNAISL